MNRKKLIELLIANLSNAVVHQVLEYSLEEDYVRKKYNQEYINSVNIGKKYREKINPINLPLSDKDKNYIIAKIKNNSLKELKLRIDKGYKGINIGLVDDIIEKILNKMKI